MAKQAIGQTMDLAMIAKKRLNGRQQLQKPKPNKECFNYKKKDITLGIAT